VRRFIAAFFLFAEGALAEKRKQRFIAALQNFFRYLLLQALFSLC
jgi:hypothetical protein